MRTSSLRVASGLVPLVAWLAMSGCGGTPKAAPAEPSVTYAPPPAPPPIDEPPVAEEPIRQVAAAPPTVEPIRFGFNEYRITTDAQMALQNVSVVLKEHPDWTVLLEGHCDERGTNEYNLSLGESRAQSAKRYLVSLGLSEERFKTISFGEERPVALGSGEESWAKNRRAEFRLQGPEL